MNQLGELAFHIWDIEFGDHTTALERERKALLISGYLEANIGQLNTLINSDFYIDELRDRVTPPLKYEEQAIFTQLYLKDYMNKQARNILRNAASDTTASTTNSTSVNAGGFTDWTELREGDTSIKRSVATATSKNSSAQILQKSAVEAGKLLKELIHSYNMYGAVPLQVAGKDIPTDEKTYVKEQSYDVELEIQKINNQFALLTQSFISTNEDIKDMEEALETIKLDIKASNIEGFTKSYAIPEGSDQITIDWSQEFFPSAVPTVLAVIKSSDTNDPILSYRIDGEITTTGVTFVFTDKVVSDKYGLELAAFIAS